MTRKHRKYMRDATDRAAVGKRYRARDSKLPCASRDLLMFLPCHGAHNCTSSLEPDGVGELRLLAADMEDFLVGTSLQG